MGLEDLSLITGAEDFAGWNSVECRKGFLFWFPISISGKTFRERRIRTRVRTVLLILATTEGTPQRANEAGDRNEAEEKTVSSWLAGR